MTTRTFPFAVLDAILPVDSNMNNRYRTGVELTVNLKNGQRCIVLRLREDKITAKILKRISIHNTRRLTSIKQSERLRNAMVAGTFKFLSELRNGLSLREISGTGGPGATQVASLPFTSPSITPTTSATESDTIAGSLVPITSTAVSASSTATVPAAATLMVASLR
jgi:hypothetical protein